MTPHVHWLLLLVHLLAAVIWIGGMVFAHFALRPAAVEVLEPAPRLRLMTAALGRFFRIVLVAVLAILASGLALLATAGFAQAPWPWHLMLLTGLTMSAIFALIYGRVYPALRAATQAQAWPEAAAALQRIRALVSINLCLGLVTLVAAIGVRA